MTYGIAILINCLQLSEESRKYFPPYPLTIPWKLIDFPSAVRKHKLPMRLAKSAGEGKQIEQ